MLLFAFNSPGVIFLLKANATDIAAAWFKNCTKDNKQNNATNNPFHKIPLNEKARYAGFSRKLRGDGR